MSQRSAARNGAVRESRHELTVASIDRKVRVLGTKQAAVADDNLAVPTPPKSVQLESVVKFLPGVLINRIRNLLCNVENYVQWKLRGTNLLELPLLAPAPGRQAAVRSESVDKCDRRVAVY